MDNNNHTNFIFENFRIMNKHIFYLIIFSFLFVNKAAISQSISPDKVVDVNIIVPHTISSSGIVDAEVILTIKKGWHINANKPLDDNLSPTVLDFKESPGVQIQNITYPTPQTEKLSFSDSKLALYQNEVIMKVQFKVNKKAGAQPLKLDGVLKYQACNNESCLFPVSKPVSIILGPKKSK
jgi:DsbC/DsbD-like thiol-disulfide interchange protein